MNPSILDLLKTHKYETSHLINDPLVLKINKLLEKNNCLKVTFTDKGTVLLRKKMNYKYNISIEIINEPGGWITYDEILGKMGVPINLTYIFEGIKKILNRNENRSNISEQILLKMREEKKLEEQQRLESLKEKIIKEIKHLNKSSVNEMDSENDDENLKQSINVNTDFDESINEDPFSERSIMRDLENGEGEKHGF